MAVLPIGMSGEAGGYQIERSLRFNSADSANLTKTPASNGNRKTFTWSAWIKRSRISTDFEGIFSASTGLDQIRFENNDVLRIALNATSSADLVTTQVFRDVGAWGHLVVAFDTTQATSSNRIKAYWNGVQITAFSTATYPSQNYDCAFNSTLSQQIGSATNSTLYFNGYLTDINFIDGSALTPSSFGETDSDTGVWKPKAYSGSYGTNGFYLKFADNSGTTSTTLGKDSSGNGNNWTPNNFSVTAGAGNDSLVDTPTPYGTDTGAGGEVRGNYCTLNPLSATGGVTLANGNLDFSGGSTSIARGTIGATGGKFYFEFVNGTNVGGLNPILWGLANISGLPAAHDNWLQAVRFYTDGTSSSSLAHFQNGSSVQSITVPSGLRSLVIGDILQIAYDGSSGKVWVGVNNTWVDNSGGTTGNPGAGTNQTFTLTDTSIPMTPLKGHAGVAWSGSLNCGQRPFAYTAPSGFKALCTQNLPEPTVVQGDDYFNTVLYTGNGSTQSITGVGFQPDFSWFKTRNSATHHALVDAVRGVDKYIYSSLTSAEDTQTNALASFDADGFSFAGSFGNVNRASDTYVAWNWKANGSGVSNTDGSITSTVSANTTSGFSIVTWTGTGVGSSTVGHGLGVAPSFVIVKQRGAANGLYNWNCYHSSLGKAAFIALNTTGAAVTSDLYLWSNTAPTSSVITLGSSTSDYVNVNNYNGTGYVAYCFAPVAGFSAFGSYTGNDSTDGPFVYTGFRPAFVLIKCTTAAAGWIINNSKMPNYNVTNLGLTPSGADAEFSAPIDILSNGFKLRNSSGSQNDPQTYIYACFAENPFKYSLGR